MTSTMRCDLLIVRRALKMRHSRCALFTQDLGRVTKTYGYLEMTALARTRTPLRIRALTPGSPSRVGT
jgi:hypothetical protein